MNTLSVIENKFISACVLGSKYLKGIEFLTNFAVYQSYLTILQIVQKNCIYIQVNKCKYTLLKSSILSIMFMLMLVGLCKGHMQVLEHK